MSVKVARLTAGTTEEPIGGNEPIVAVQVDVGGNVADSGAGGVPDPGHKSN